MNWRAAKEEANPACVDGCDRGRTHKNHEEGEKRRTNDFLAEKVGFKSGRQLERATYVAKNSPELMAEVDDGKKSITRAYEESRGIERKKPAIKPDLPSNMGQIHGMLGHIDSEFQRPDGAKYVLEEVKIAAAHYLMEIRTAASHYTSIMQNDETNKTISIMLRDAFYDAAEAFGDNYIEEEETT